ncbi:TRAP transporter permease [Salinisphaera orenii]|uniref:C4-dicarboxylate ABC transporter permease n=1 Tax=Salinisphaera orenii YIM 95161 TaxID=1051139 RepID=A0A423PTR3_9GAMM|nr:TRAP transporter fused permease subunit [Salinisphaera halophila]ROO28974.1 C4-dicarboxylate ABC transporter permease [Salinisphaera halophila YIM 95161]
MLQNRRPLTGLWALFARLMAALVPVSTIVYVSRVLPDMGLIVYKEQFLAFFLTLCLALTFMTVPARAAHKQQAHVPWYDVILVLAALAIGGYISFEYGSLITTMGLITDDKVLVSAIGVVLLLEAARRQAGWVMVGLALVALSYAYFGHHLSGVFETRVIGLDRLLIYNYLGTGAILGTPLYVAATIVAAFVLFGQVLFLVGGGDAISNFAFALMGRRRGGPAKVAVLSSAFFGSLSGSASGNVATTGMLTIPMMRRVGYSDTKAAAIEAVASTGGLVLPPVMAATGFLMAEFLGIPYSTVAIAAAIPALLFYLCVYLQVDMEAGRNGITGWQGDDLPGLRRSCIEILPVVLPFAGLLYTLFALYWSPAASAFMGTGITIIVSLALAWMRQSARGYFNVIATAGEAVVFIAIMCAVAGLVVGCLGLTGLGSSLAQNLVTLSGGSVWLLLGFAAIGCIVLGMGVPVTATYIILVILVGPALVEVGVDDLSAHMFVFYFGTLSFLTPPVCLAVFVAASIAQSPPMRTAGYALRFAIVAYLIPFVFVFNPAFLFQGTWLEIANATVAGIVGVFLLSAGLVGYLKAPLSIALRVLLVGAGLVALFLCGTSWLVTLFAVALLIVVSRYKFGSSDKRTLGSAPVS